VEEKGRKIENSGRRRMKKEISRRKLKKDIRQWKKRDEREKVVEEDG
jgi:hypothetical protein